MNTVRREAGRALVLDPDDRVLLVRFVEPETGGEFWATPGSGLDPGEELKEGLRRELREETGLEDPEIGPVIWTRREVFEWAGKTLDQRERIVLVRVPWFEPNPELTAEQLAAEGVYEVRWWTLKELESSDAVFYPTRLAMFLRRLLQSGEPDEPIDVGV
ncbi:MAG TPA: NUDIX domain-containing protein [Gaiellaceae bacterium]|nr:NUDIX domain-containing protein [Gaiellaceae bacterium]